MAYHPGSVANHFLNLGDAAKTPITNMKIQKLVFFAHGWHLAAAGGPLVDRQPEAWEYGPVFPDLYHEFKRFGSRPITSRAERRGPGHVDLSFTIEDPAAAPVAEAICGVIWANYRDIGAPGLSAISHRAGSPWSVTRKEKGDGGLISDDITRAYYAEQLG